ncbi:MAG TPA: class I SAM-dependent methyltransferase [Gaiellaceae bacterium]|nr:class I SAM-dependent methyltransferase [Gaiellaceae bacterium]
MSIRERVFAALYDPMSATAERKFGAESKRKLLANARGRVLEIGVGTGLSFPHYPQDVELVGVEPSLPMLRRAQQRAAELGRDVTLVEAPAEKLPFEDGSFDTTVSLAVLCSVDDPARVLDELRRVLRPGGRFLFIEHVRSDDPESARRQDRYARPWGWFACGCHPNRDTLGSIEAAGFEVVEVEHEERPEVPRLVRPHVRGWGQAA